VSRFRATRPRVAFVYGPIVLAGRLGTAGLYSGADILRSAPRAKVRRCILGTAKIGESGRRRSERALDVDFDELSERIPDTHQSGSRKELEDLPERGLSELSAEHRA
jgi:hypothetical protein